MNAAAASLPSGVAHAPAADPEPFVVQGPDGIASLILLVDGVHCAGCVNRIEKELANAVGVVSARVNLTTKRLSVSWRSSVTNASRIVALVDGLGYGAVPFSADTGSGGHGDRQLMRALAVAGFGSANVMLLSFALWSGALGDMGEATRGLFQWVSALIVLPTAAYAIRPFLGSALAGLKRGEMRMDLPISVGVLLTLAISLLEAVRGGPHVYFDGAASLLFFLLVGRVLDRHARARACDAAENLMVLRGTTATVVADDGTLRAERVENLRPGMTVLVAAGARIPADGTVAGGASDVDTSLVTGETVPAPVGVGTKIFAGTLNRTGALTVTVMAAGEGTLLSEIARLMEAAGQSRAKLVRLADRAARIYAPVVHLAALATFAMWWGVLGAPWQPALLTAVSVLIITCPCALGLAVPVVQVVASGRLMKRGILLKATDGLERLASVDTVVLDKTGTLTLGQLHLINKGDVEADALADAGAIAAASRHPLCQALVAAAGAVSPRADVAEHPGLGLSAATACGEMRLGSRAWCGIAELDDADAAPELWLARPGQAPVRFVFEDTLRPDAAATVAELKRMGLAVELLSGDRPGAVRAAADAAGILAYRPRCSPAEKIFRLQELARFGRTVLMVGDGLNDAPALAAAHVSMSPAAAADVTQAAADVVFQGEKLGAVVDALRIARASRRLMMQNFVLTAIYNIVAVPFAIAGLVTPLIAAIAMSGSSLAVIGNALRLRSPTRTP
ncbi:MAG: heavy metal translocating P-type ATPase [Gemmatimonas sp.]